MIAMVDTELVRLERCPVTPAVFGDYIDVYDIQQAVEDEVTVRIYYVVAGIRNTSISKTKAPSIILAFANYSAQTLHCIGSFFRVRLQNICPHLSKYERTRRLQMAPLEYLSDIVLWSWYQRLKCTCKVF